MQKTLRIVDGNNFYRRTMESDPTGLTIRTILRQIDEDPGHFWLWVWDGRNGLARRREIYPGYKRKRIPAAENVYGGMELAKQILTHVPVMQVEIPGWEADDVIATLAQNHDGPVVIQSTDSDFLQLVDSRVSLTRDPIPDLPPNQVRLYKACVGDSSDNITGIPGFGQVSWSRIDKGALQYLIDQKVPDYLLDRLTLPQKSRRWLLANPQELLNMYEIVGFYTVPEDLILNHMVMGEDNVSAIDQLLGEFLL